MVDVGDGTVIRLAEGGIPVRDIESIFFIHHHADHNGGFPYMLINGWMNGRKKLNLVGPPKTNGYYDFLLKLYEGGIRCIPTYEYTIGFDMAMDNQIVIKNAAHIYADESLADSVTL